MPQNTQKDVLSRLSVVTAGFNGRVPRRSLSLLQAHQAPSDRLNLLEQTLPEYSREEPIMEKLSVDKFEVKFVLHQLSNVFSSSGLTGCFARTFFHKHN